MMIELPSTRGCFACGEYNPIGLKLKFQTDGQIVTSRFIPDAHHCGFVDTMHGGLISTVLDELMAWVAIVHLKRFAYCGELSVRFLEPIPPGQEVQLLGRLVSNRRNRILEIESEATASGKIYSRGTGKYLPVPEDQAKTMNVDLIGEWPAELK